MQPSALPAPASLRLASQYASHSSLPDLWRTLPRLGVLRPQGRGFPVNVDITAARCVYGNLQVEIRPLPGGPADRALWVAIERIDVPFRRV